MQPSQQAPYLLDVVHTLVDILQLEVLLNAVGHRQDGVVLLQGLLHQVGPDGREVRQVPQQFQHLRGLEGDTLGHLQHHCHDQSNNQL